MTSILLTTVTHDHVNVSDRLLWRRLLPTPIHSVDRAAFVFNKSDSRLKFFLLHVGCKLPRVRSMHFPKTVTASDLGNWENQDFGTS